MRNRHCRNLNAENTKPFRNDPDDPSAAALKVIITKFCFNFSSMAHEKTFFYSIALSNRNLGMKKSDKFVNHHHMDIFKVGSFYQLL